MKILLQGLFIGIFVLVLSGKLGAEEKINTTQANAIPAEKPPVASEISKQQAQLETAAQDLMEKNKELTEKLISQLGITEAQAKGGVGALFQAAEKKLSAEEFQSISKSVPDLDGLMQAAPQQSEKEKKLSKKLSAFLGKKNEKTVDSIVGLVSAFKELNLSVDDAKQFVPIVVDYVKANAGEDPAKLLDQALSDL